MLVTLGDRHHLDGSVVIGSCDHLVELVDDPTQVVSGCGLVGDSLRRSVEELAHREHLILARIKGELHPCPGAPTRTSGEWRLSDTSAKHRRVTLSIYFEHLL